MSTTTAEKKALLRQHIRALLSATPDRDLHAEDERLFSRFLSLPEVAQANTLFLFCGVGTEPDTAQLFTPLLAQGKRIALPRMLPGCQMELRQYCPEHPLVTHPFGIPEPDTDCPLLSPDEIDLVLVPGLCYDRRGFRLGMGGGYYDRWLPHYTGITVGLCRNALLQDALPTEPHDRTVDILITPTMRIDTK